MSWICGEQRGSERGFFKYFGSPSPGIAIESVVLRLTVSQSVLVSLFCHESYCLSVVRVRKWRFG